MPKLVNHCELGRYHMLERIAYDLILQFKNRQITRQEIEAEIEKQNDKDKFKEYLNKWLTK
jgi:hypothetical protein